MSELSPQHQRENRAFLAFMHFARQEPSLLAPTNDALAQILRRFNDIILPATECMARLRPEMAELYWDVIDQDGEITNSDTKSGPMAYETWHARHELPVDSRATLNIHGADESTDSNLLVFAPEISNERLLETALHGLGLYRDVRFSVAEDTVDVKSFVYLNSSKPAGVSVNLDVLEDSLTVPLPLAAEDIHDPRAAQAFGESREYGLIHHQLYRCAVDLCGMVEADRLVRDFT